MPAKRDYEAAPVAESLGLRDVILGLVGDMNALRAGTISPQDALARAAIAKQVFNGVRLYVQASRFLGEAASPVGQIEEEPTDD
jgi:hypothetical protein